MKTLEVTWDEVEALLCKHYKIENVRLSHMTGEGERSLPKPERLFGRVK